MSFWQEVKGMKLINDLESNTCNTTIIDIAEHGITQNNTGKVLNINDVATNGDPVRIDGFLGGSAVIYMDFMISDIPGNYTDLLQLLDSDANEVLRIYLADDDPNITLRTDQWFNIDSLYLPDTGPPEIANPNEGRYKHPVVGQGNSIVFAKNERVRVSIELKGKSTNKTVFGMEYISVETTLYDSDGEYVSKYVDDPGYEIHDSSPPGGTDLNNGHQKYYRKDIETIVVGGRGTMHPNAEIYELGVYGDAGIFSVHGFAEGLGNVHYDAATGFHKGYSDPALTAWSDKVINRHSALNWVEYSGVYRPKQIITGNIFDTDDVLTQESENKYIYFYGIKSVFGYEKCIFSTNDETSVQLYAGIEKQRDKLSDTFGSITGFSGSVNWGSKSTAFFNSFLQYGNGAPFMWSKDFIEDDKCSPHWLVSGHAMRTKSINAPQVYFGNPLGDVDKPHYDLANISDGDTGTWATATDDGIVGLVFDFSMEDSSLADDEYESVSDPSNFRSNLIDTIIVGTHNLYRPKSDAMLILWDGPNAAYLDNEKYRVWVSQLDPLQVDSSLYNDAGITEALDESQNENNKNNIMVFKLPAPIRCKEIGLLLESGDISDEIFVSNVVAGLSISPETAFNVGSNITVEDLSQQVLRQDGVIVSKNNKSVKRIALSYTHQEERFAGRVNDIRTNQISNKLMYLESMGSRKAGVTGSFSGFVTMQKQFSMSINTNLSYDYSVEFRESPSYDLGVLENEHIDYFEIRDEEI